MAADLVAAAMQREHVVGIAGRPFRRLDADEAARDIECSPRFMTSRFASSIALLCIVIKNGVFAR